MVLCLMNTKRNAARSIPTHLLVPWLTLLFISDCLPSPGGTLETQKKKKKKEKKQIFQIAHD